MPPIQAEFSVDEQLNQDEEEKEAPQLGENQETNVQKESAPQGEQAEITPLGKIQEFGYNAAKIPTFAPTGAVPPIQAEFSVDEQLNQDEEEKETDVVAPDAVKKINIPENIESGQTISEVDRIAARNIESVKLAPPQNNESEKSNPQEIPDVTTPDKIQRKSHQRNKKSQSQPDTLTPLQAKKLPDSGDDSISNYKEKFIVRDRNEEESFLQPKKLPSESLDFNKQAGFNLAQVRESQEVIVQRQPAPQGEKAEMNPAQRQAEATRLNNLGVALGNNQGNHQAALQYFEEAIKLRPQVSLYFYNKGTQLSRLNRHQEAISAYETALALNMEWGDAKPSYAWRNRGYELTQLGRYDQAIQSYQQAVKLDPSDTFAQNNIRNLEKFLSENPSLRNQQQQNSESEADSGNNPLQILFGALQGEWNENQTLPVATVGLLISLIPVIGEFADARDLAAYAYRIIFKKEYDKLSTWLGLTLSLVGVIPLVGDIAKFLGKTGGAGISQYLDDIVKLIRSVNPDFVDITKLRNAFTANWDSGVKAGKEKWNTALNQLSSWLDNIPDILFRTEQQKLRQAIAEVRSQSDGMLSEAFAGIKSKIDEALDEIGRSLNSQGELVTPEGVRVPSNGVDEVDHGPMRIEGGEQTPSPRNTRFLNVEEAREFIARKIASGERITLDLFGGRISQIPGAVNIDLVAEDGIRATIADLARIFPDNSVDEIVASGPQAEFLEEVARMVKPGGRIYINANFSNRYRFGTSRGKKPPNAETLERLGLRLVQDDGSLDPRFGDLEFRRTDGGEIPRGTVKTIIFEKVE